MIFGDRNTVSTRSIKARLFFFEMSAKISEKVLNRKIQMEGGGVKM